MKYACLTIACLVIAATTTTGCGSKGSEGGSLTPTEQQAFRNANQPLTPNQVAAEQAWEKSHPMPRQAQGGATQ